MEKILLGLGLVFVIHRLSANDTKPLTRTTTKPTYTPPVRLIESPTKSRLIRACDPKGCGHFGASRGSRQHKGVDFITVPGESVYSPVDGVVERYPDPYGDGKYSGIQIKGTGRNLGQTIKIFYLLPSVEIGRPVTKGQLIGKSEDIRLRHGSDMTNHIHVELITGGSKVDFKQFI